MLSKLFDKSSKGRHVYPLRTICEVHRDIYDMLILEFAENNLEGVRKIIPLLEEAFVMGVKMNKKLIEYKLDYYNREDKWDETDMPKASNRRQRRKELVELLKYHKAVLEKTK